MSYYYFSQYSEMHKHSVLWFAQSGMESIFSRNPDSGPAHAPIVQRNVPLFQYHPGCGGLFLSCKDFGTLGEDLTIHSLPALFFFCLSGGQLMHTNSTL